MIITEQILSGENAEFYNIPDKCFYCGNKLVDIPLIMWQGFLYDQVWLHVDCAKKLGSILTKEGKQSDE